MALFQFLFIKFMSESALNNYDHVVSELYLKLYLNNSTTFFGFRIFVFLVLVWVFDAL